MQSVTCEWFVFNIYRVLADIIIPFGNSEIAVEMISSLIEKRRNATVDTKQIKCSNVKSQEKTNEI